MVWFILDLEKRNKMNEKNEKYFNHQETIDFFLCIDLWFINV